MTPVTCVHCGRYDLECLYDTVVNLMLKLPAHRAAHPVLVNSALTSLLFVFRELLSCHPVPDPAFLLCTLPVLSSIMNTFPSPLGTTAAAILDGVTREVLSPGWNYRSSVHPSFLSFFRSYPTLVSLLLLQDAVEGTPVVRSFLPEFVADRNCVCVSVGGAAVVRAVCILPGRCEGCDAAKTVQHYRLLHANRGYRCGDHTCGRR